MKEFIKVGIIYSFVKYLVMGLGVIKSFYIASSLGPTFLGSYAIVMLIVEYLNYSNLGVFASMNRDVAIYLEDEKKQQYVNKVINTALSFTILPLMVILISFLVFEFTDLNFLPQELKEYSWMILILVVFNQLKIFSLRYLRLYSRYYELMTLEFLAQLINLIGVILFVEKYSIDAVIWSVLISNIFFNLVAFFYVKKIKFHLNLSLIKYLIFSGFPMLLYAVILTLLSSVDRIVIAAAFEGRNSLGLYQFAFLGAQGLFMAFNSIAFLFYPRWIKHFHETDDSISKFDSIKDQSIIIEFILALLSMIGIVFIPTFINILLPDYQLSILVTQFLLIAFIANGLTFITSTFLISNNHQLKIVPIVSFAVLSALLMNYLFIWLGYGLYGIAASTVIAFFSYAFVMTFLTLKIINAVSIKNILFFYKRLFVFVPLTVILLYEQYSLIWIFILFAVTYFGLVKEMVTRFKKIYKSKLTQI